MGQWIQLSAKDGHVLDAYVAQPAEPEGVLIVLQEIFGVNSHIQAVCDRFENRRHIAIAPALFDRVKKSQSLGYDSESVAAGRALKAQVSDEQALMDVQAAIDWAGKEGLPVAVAGFCWGGTLAWLAAARLSGLCAAVAYYGTNIAGYLDDAPRVPVLLHFGELDANIPPEKVDAIARAYPDIALYRYPAGHGFNCEDRPAFHARSADAATERTRQFLKEHMPC